MRMNQKQIDTLYNRALTEVVIDEGYKSRADIPLSIQMKLIGSIIELLDLVDDKQKFIDEVIDLCSS